MSHSVIYIVSALAAILLAAPMSPAQVRFDEVLYSWPDANDLQDWSLFGAATDLTSKGGMLFFSTQAGVNRLQSPDSLGLPADDYGQVEFELRNKSGAGQADLYFITDEDPSWDAAKSVAIPIVTNDYFNRRYTLELPALSGQTLKAFRIELTVSSGEEGTVYCDSFDVKQGSGNHTWNWNRNSDALGWTLGGTASGLDVSGGIVSYTSTGNDPTWTSPDGLSFDAKSVNSLIVRFKNSSSSTGAAVYWNRSDTSGFSQQRVKTFPIVPNDSGFSTYTVDFSSAASWTGTITRLRLDLPNGESSGAFSEVDWVDLQYAGVLPRPDADNSRYFLPLQRNFMIGNFPDYRFQELKDQLGAESIYTRIGSAGIIEPEKISLMAGGLPRFRAFDLFYAPIFTIPLLGGQRDLLEATDLREFQWRLNGETWSSDENVEDWGGDRNYKRVTYSRLAPLQNAYEEERARGWAQDLQSVLQGYEERVPVFNLLVESELPSAGSTDDGQLGDYSPYAITEFRDWLRHTGIYDATTGEFTGEGAPEDIVGSLINQRSPFYDDPTPADANGTGESFNTHFGTGFTTWTLRYWDLDAFPAAITDTNFTVSPQSGTGFTAGGFDAPRAVVASDPFWQAWSWDTFDQGGAYAYPTGNPDQPAFGFRQHLVRNFGRDIFDIMVEEGLPADHLFLHQIPGEFINAGRQRSGATPIWTGYTDNGMLGLTRFGTVPDVDKLLQYVNLTGKQNRGWGFFEWHPKPADSDGTLRDTDAYIENAYTTTFSELEKLVPSRMRAVTPGWWDFSGSGFNWNTFPTWNSGMVEAIKAFSAQYPDVPFWHQGPDMPDYIPPAVEKLIALPGAGAAQHGILIASEIWSDYRNTWSQWGGLDHFEIEQRADGGDWETAREVAQPGAVLFSNRVAGVVYEYRVRAVSATDQAGDWSQFFNWTTADFDGDGLPDSAEGIDDADGDGLANYEDLDSDGDTQSDAQEAAAGRDPFDGIFESSFNTDGDFESWVTNQIDNANVAGGILSGDTASNDPKLYINNGFSILGDEITCIVIRLKKSVSATTDAEYFWDNEDGSFHPSRRDSFTTTNDGQFHTYFLNPADGVNATNWIGKTIEGFRFDPNRADDGSSFEIDYILFSDGDFDNDGAADWTEGGDSDFDGDGLGSWEDPDSDNDGFLDWEEDVAGTGRLDPDEDAFLISKAVPVRIDGKAGRRYFLQRSDRLIPVEWSIVETVGLLPADQTVVFTNGTSSANGFYRVLVEKPEE